MRKILTILALLGCAAFSLAEESATDVLDYGDYTSVTLMVKAWDALGSGKFEDAVKYTEKCAELFESKARAMQSKLTAKAPPDKVNDYWALNDVGTCYFIRGEALAKLKRTKEALAAYKVVMDELYYAQAWDPKGWHWSPADAAYPKIEMLEAQQKVDF